MNKITALTQVSTQRYGKYHQRSSWAVWLIFSLAILIILGLNLKLFFMMKDYPLETKIIRVKLNEVTEILNSYEQRNLDLFAQLKNLGVGLYKLNAQISETESRITRLETANDGNKAALDNLTKAKDTLFSKFSSLESELATLKNAQIPTNNR